MEEIRFESLTALYERLYPAFNTKCNELKSNNINVTEIDLWNYLKDHKWKNNRDITMASLVEDILHIDIDEFLKYKNEEGDKIDI